MRLKTYTDEDESFVKYLKQQRHTVKEIAELSELSTSVVYRILAKPEKQKDRLSILEDKVVELEEVVKSWSKVS